MSYLKINEWMLSNHWVASYPIDLFYYKFINYLIIIIIDNLSQPVNSMVEKTQISAKCRGGCVCGGGVWCTVVFFMKTQSKIFCLILSLLIT